MANMWQIFRRLLGGQRADVLVAVAVVSILLIFIVPIPSFLLDFLMILNLGFALLVILLVLYNQDPLELSVFPTILLLSTVFALMLNVASTRLILTQGADFQGRVVNTFARFVAGSEGQNGLVTGLIIFLIIVIVQFLVITKGSTRISEVAARFALDAMPGKQMAIDAEFSSGAISETEAKKRRRKLEKTSDFYGRMDGATKFISGSVKAGIVITLTNIIGGLITGSLRGETLVASLGIYSRLTIGDGLVSQIPVLIISIATGLVVTQAGSEDNFSQQTRQQFSLQPRIYLMLAAFLTGLALLPGFPWYLLLPLAAGCVYLGMRLLLKKEQESSEQQLRQQASDETEPPPVALLDPLSIELGYALIPLVDKNQGAELLERIANVRREIALELGLVIPKVRIIDNMRLLPSGYSIKLHGMEVGRGDLRVEKLLALLPPGEEKEALEGELVNDPTFQLPARWILPEQRDRAEQLNYTVVDLASIITTHLSEIVRKHAADLLGRQEVKNIFESLRAEQSALIEELEKEFSLAGVQKVLHTLLREKVVIRNIVTILESIADLAQVTKEHLYISEQVRKTLARQLSLQYASEKREIFAIATEQRFEQLLLEHRLETPQGVLVALKPEQLHVFNEELEREFRRVSENGITVVLLCSEQVRPLLAYCSRRVFPDLAVLSFNEIADGFQLNLVGSIGKNVVNVSPDVT